MESWRDTSPLFSQRCYRKSLNIRTVSSNVLRMPYRWHRVKMLNRSRSVCSALAKAGGQRWSARTTDTWHVCRTSIRAKWLLPSRRSCDRSDRVCSPLSLSLCMCVCVSRKTQKVLNGFLIHFSVCIHFWKKGDVEDEINFRLWYGLYIGLQGVMRTKLLMLLGGGVCVTANQNTELRH